MWWNFFQKDSIPGSPVLFVRKKFPDEHFWIAKFKLLQILHNIFCIFILWNFIFETKNIFASVPKTLETNRNCKHVCLAFFFAFLVHYKILRDQGKIYEFHLTWKLKFTYKMRKKSRFSFLTFHLQNPKHAYSETFLQLIIKLIFLISRWPKKWYTEISRGPSR